MNFSTEALVVDHEPGRRFVINHEGYQAELLYKLKGESINFLHTEVPTQMGGKGVGKVLAKVTLVFSHSSVQNPETLLFFQEGIQFAKDKDLKVKVSCDFVKHYLDKYEPNFEYVSKL